jgi:lipid II isoglutaminyl synthase (glutamine-hydrolysing)
MVKPKQNMTKIESGGKYALTIVHLYPKEMNIYGDMGNIITLKRRMEWRGIEVTYKQINLGDTEFPEGDIYFMGGGQDNDMYQVFADMIALKKDFLRAEVLKGKVFLLICGAFQLFGKYFLDASGRTISGLGILPLETKAPGDQLKDRCLGNLLTVIRPGVAKEIRLAYPDAPYDLKGEAPTLVGFENHSGQTYFLDESIVPMAVVRFGKGNNAEQRIEGAKYLNVIGSYSHGSLLPKNPHLADYLIWQALKNKYGSGFSWQRLDDEVEWRAHLKIQHRLEKTGK